MKNQNRKSSLSSGILLLTIGGIFTAIGIAMTVIVIGGLIKKGISNIGAGILMPIVMILALLGFGITALVMGGKQIYSRIRQSITYRHGKESTASIINYKTASFGRSGNTRIRYALVLSYDDGKTFTTDYLYDVNEFNYLKKLKNVKVKTDGNFLTVCEPFPKCIYKVDSYYGIELKFYRQKPVKTLLILWMVFFLVAFIFFIISFFIGNRSVSTAAIITLFAVHFPFVIPLSIYLIKWLIRKK